MPLFEMEFKIRHACKLGEISHRFPHARILVWRIQDREIIEVVPTKKKIECSDVYEELSRIDGIQENSLDKGRGFLISKGCPCVIEDILDECVEQLNILPLWPVSYHGGWQYHKIVAFDHDDINKLLGFLEERSFIPWILRKVQFNGFTGGMMTLTLENVFSNLTARQTDAILTAYAHGYYKLPRDSDLQTIADDIGVPRTTFQEHLKKAENKIINALVPHIHTWHHFAGFRGRHPMIRESPLFEEIER